MPYRNEKIILYYTADGKVTVDVRFEAETFWVTQKAMSQLFDVQVPAIAKHLKNIYDEDELEYQATVSKMETVQVEGSRKVTRMVDLTIWSEILVGRQGEKTNVQRILY